MKKDCNWEVWAGIKNNRYGTAFCKDFHVTAEDIPHAHKIASGMVIQFLAEKGCVNDSTFEIYYINKFPSSS